jgi:[ribosomal protein S5]-alanine N-acetyltransferase
MQPFDFAAFPTLTTPRLLLRELMPDDAADVFVFRSDPEVQKYNGVPLSQPEEAQELIAAVRGGYEGQHNILWAITRRDNGRVIGLAGFGYWDQYHARAAVGYDLARDQWQQGITTEAMQMIIQFGFERMLLHRIEAETIADHTASVRLLEKLGFQREGVRREFSLEDDGVYHDDAIYGLLRREYSAGL